MAKINFKQFNIRQSPYHKEFMKNLNPINVRLEGDARELLQEHFEEIYGQERGALSNGIRSIIHDYLDKLCLKKRVFNHLEAVMLIPKGDREKMENESQIIAVINTESDFNNVFNHNEGFYEDSGAIFELKLFNQGNFNYTLEMLKNALDSCVFNTSKKDMESFQSFKSKQGELYPDLDLDDCYFVRFPLNNYMDNTKHGKSVHFQSWKNNHLGALVFIDAVLNIKRFLLIDWYYVGEISSQIIIDFQFAQEDFFMDCIMNAGDFDSNHEEFDSDDGGVFEALGEAFDDDFQQGKLKELEADYSYKLNVIRRLIHND